MHCKLIPWGIAMKSRQDPNHGGGQGAGVEDREEGELVAWGGDSLDGDNESIIFNFIVFSHI